MITIQTAMNQLTGKEIVDSLVQMMNENFADFKKERIQYEGVMLVLQKNVKEEGVPSAQDDMEAIQQQIASGLLFSGLLGIKANLDNYIDPINRNFLDVDPETYLRENVAHTLPRHQDAQAVRNQFYAALSQDQRKLYEAVITYVTHLETVGPKLAHYYGYMFGNQLLPLVIPGYVPDMALTSQYRMMIEMYLGKRLEERG